jgi:dienelactone hydrolase
MRLAIAFLLLSAAFPFIRIAYPQDQPPAPLYPDHANLLIVLDQDGQAKPVRTPDDWLIRRAHILYHLQQVMGPLPPRQPTPPPPAVQVLETAETPAFTRRKILLALDDQDTLPAWLFLPKRAGSTRSPAMLCLHQTTPVGKDEPAGLGGSPDLHYARELAERGYVTLAPDYPRFGEHKVDPYALGYASATMKAIADNLRAVDYLASLPEVDPERIGVIGHSLGGHNALFTAVFDPRLKAVITSCGFTSFPRYYGGKIAGWSHQGYMPRLQSVYNLEVARVPFDFPEILAAVAPRGVYINAPIHDDNFDLQGVRDCVASARPVYNLHRAPQDRLVLATPDAPHAFPPGVRARAYAFLDQLFNHAPANPQLQLRPQPDRDPAHAPPLP